LRGIRDSKDKGKSIKDKGESEVSPRIMIKIDRKMIEETSRMAASSLRKRQNRNFHVSYDDPINRMLNAVEPEAYFPPHKHVDPPKREVFVILKGRVLMVEFDDGGKITDHVLLEAAAGNFGVEIAPGVWHSLIPLERGSVLYELKDGPYSKEADKVFAPWAPAEGAACAGDFVRKVLAAVGV